VAMIPTPGSMFPGGGGVGLVPRVTVNQFFDRRHVTDALTRGEHRALSRASLHVRRTAAKSIRKMGLAKPKLKILSTFPGMSLADIARLPGMTRETSATMRDSQGRFLRGSGMRRTRDGGITDTERARVIERIKEIKTRPPSAPGTPPHTHVPHGMMLGFRRNLYNAYDGRTHSAVVGPTAKGPRPQMPSLHEFGGSRRMLAYIWRPKYQPYKTPLVKWFPSDEEVGASWIPTGRSKSVLYPPRPFMRPALEKSRAFIAAEFRDILGR
jgi:hypothetical protein